MYSGRNVRLCGHGTKPCNSVTTEQVLTGRSINRNYPRSAEIWALDMPSVAQVSEPGQMQLSARLPLSPRSFPRSCRSFKGFNGQLVLNAEGGRNALGLDASHRFVRLAINGSHQRDSPVLDNDDDGIFADRLQAAKTSR